jgi:hypothetical protein
MSIQLLPTRFYIGTGKMVVRESIRVHAKFVEILARQKFVHQSPSE